MSHEVNNSVGAIGSTLHVVSDIINSGEQGAWEDVLPAVDASSDRCRHLAQFIGNLADMVKIPPPTLSPISLNEQVRAVDALTRIECQRRNIKLTLQPAEEDRLIYVDGIQFEQVLVNIVKNAYESIGRDGEIRIKASSDPLSIVIEDNGPGITDEINKKLFTPFFTTKPSGQGMGLMFVRDVLTNHHCRFNLYTAGGRTRFEIYFDLA
jgi:signal transduction histidine kinase